jgi:UDP-N-acetylmuramyl tripeptide synthase
MPLFAGGVASYNIANAAAASLAACALGVAPEVISTVLADFGADPDDNPGRLERHALGGLTLVVDYAHNPAGLDGLLRVASALRLKGRLALLLGQAGNRRDSDLRLLAQTAAAYSPDLIVLKGIDGYARGRAEDEVATRLRADLIELQYPETQLDFVLREIDAVRTALAWAKPGDILVLPVHALAARAATKKLIRQLADGGWQAGQPLPT